MFNRHGKDVGRSIRSHGAAFTSVRPAAPCALAIVFLQAQSTAPRTVELL
jgi:hypothetical protein